MFCAVLGALAFARLLWGGLERDGGIASLLAGPDDFMRLVQVVDWVDGQAWNDLVQRRLNPPHGVAMHWSRLADIPLAAAVVLGEPWLGRDEALQAAVLIVPALLGGCFIGLFCWASAPLAPNRQTLPVVLMIPALLGPMQQFRPGRIDHHGLQLLLAILAIGYLIRVLESHGSPAVAGGPRLHSPRRSQHGRGAAALGAVCGVSLAVGLETLPFIAAVTAALGLAWVLRGNGAELLWAFGIGLSATTLAMLALTRPPAEWTTIACDRLSVGQLPLALLALAVGAAASRVPGRVAGTMARLILPAGIGMAGLALIALTLPACVLIPYANLAEGLGYWIDNVSEAQSLLALLQAKPDVAIAQMMLPLAALVFVIWQIVRRGQSSTNIASVGLVPTEASSASGHPDAKRHTATTGKIRWKDLVWTGGQNITIPQWTALAMLVLVTTGLAAWQVRGVAQAGLIAAVALVPFAAAMNESAKALRLGLARLGFRLFVPIACLTLLGAPIWVARAIENNAVSSEKEENCTPAMLRGHLTAPNGLGTNAITLAAPIDLGPGILLLSPHSVLAAPYHRNVRGLVDNRRLFAGSEAEALAVVAERGIDAVLFCNKYAHFTDHPDWPGFLNKRLAVQDPPAWLNPVWQEDGVGLYRVNLL